MTDANKPSPSPLQTMHEQWERAYAAWSADGGKGPDAAAREDQHLTRAILYQRPLSALDALLLAIHVDGALEIGMNTAEGGPDSEAVAAAMEALIDHLATAANADATPLPPCARSVVDQSAARIDRRSPLMAYQLAAD